MPQSQQNNTNNDGSTPSNFINNNDNLLFENTTKYFSNSYNKNLFNAAINLINPQSNKKFIQSIITSSEQVPLQKDIKIQRFSNDKDKIVKNVDNTTIFPLANYHLENRMFNIHKDHIYGGFDTNVDERSVNNYKDISLKPLTTMDPSLDKQRNRPYTKFMLNLIRDLKINNPVHFIEETIAYIMYQYDNNLHNFGPRGNDRVTVIFSDQLNVDLHIDTKENTFCINATVIEDIAHAIRAILICCAFRGLCHNQPITIYIPTTYLHQFDYNSNLRNDSRIFTSTFLELFNTATSILNGVIPKNEISHTETRNNRLERIVDRARVPPLLNNFDHSKRFLVNVKDFYAAMMVITKSYGSFYFNGRFYNANFQLCDNLSPRGSDVYIVRSSTQAKLAYLHKFIQYVHEIDIELFSSSRLSNKFLFMVRRYYIVQAAYIKKFMGSLLRCRIDEDLAPDQQMFFDILSILDCNQTSMELEINGQEKVTISFESLSFTNLSRNNDLNNIRAYQRNPMAVVQPLQINRAAAWFNNLQPEPNGSVHHVQDRIIDMDFNRNQNNLPIYDDLYLVEYCNPFSNWNINYYGNILNVVSCEKFHIDTDGYKRWNNNKSYYMNNGNCGSYDLYGRLGRITGSLISISNSTICHISNFFLPRMYWYEDDPDDVSVIEFKMRSQDYRENNNDLYYYSQIEETPNVKFLRRRNFD